MRKMLIILVMLFAVQTAWSQEPRIVVIDGVEYRAFNAQEMKDLLRRLNDGKVCEEERAKLEERLDKALKTAEEIEVNRDKTIEVITTKLTKERDYWKSEFEAERSNTLMLEGIFRSCTGRFLGLFRICRL